MSYQDTLDKKECIRKAKKELGEFGDLLKLQGQNYNISSTSFDDVMNTVNYLNYDYKMVQRINENDEKSYYISKIYEAINKIPKDEAYILYLLYVRNHNKADIYDIIALSKSSVQRKLNNAYFHFSIALGIEIEEVRN